METFLAARYCTTATFERKKQLLVSSASAYFCDATFFSYRFKHFIILKVPSSPLKRCHLYIYNLIQAKSLARKSGIDKFFSQPDFYNMSGRNLIEPKVKLFWLWQRLRKVAGGLGKMRVLRHG